MNYEQKYNEALNKAKKKMENSRNLELLNFIDEVFPEIMESKDEKIMKELISLIEWSKSYAPSDITTDEGDEMIAWVKGHGEQNPNPYSGVSFKYNNHTFGMCVRDGGIDILYDSKLIKHIEYLCDKTGTAFNDENTTTVPKDSTLIPEPKFKVGDYVKDADGVTPWLITAITSDYYELQNILGGKAVVDHVTIDDYYHLWTIKDVEDGDILYAKSTKLDSLYFIRIFFKRESKKSGESWAYCNICSIDLEHWDFCSSAGYIEWDEYDFHLATKEQCDLLFSKMKEDGYEWDSKNKKLQAIIKSPNSYYQENCKESKEAEQFDEYEGLTDFERVLTDICRSWIGFELGWQEYIKSNARILKNTIVKQLHSVQDAPDEQEPTEMKGKTALEAIKDITVDTSHKVKTRFHEGDWVVKDGIITQILDIQKQYYIGSDTEGEDFTMSRFLSSDRVHLWTIQDAKDGDILVSSSKMQPFIFNGHYDEDTDYVYAYCGISDLVKDDSFYADENPEEEFKVWCTIETVKPATKEQRDLLFQKMKESGYEWNAETKELKKLEQNSTDTCESVFKFHEGDTIRPKDGSHKPRKIMQVDVLDRKYRFSDGCVIHFSQEDDYELVSQSPTDKTDEDEPKIQEGDWVVKLNGTNFHNGRKFSKITKIGIDGRYWLDTGKWIEVDEIRFWTVKDAVKGDILMTDAGPFIYNGVMDDDCIGAFCGIDQFNVFTISSESEPTWDTIESVIGPANQEQVECLLDRIKSVGRTWNPDTYSLS